MYLSWSIVGWILAVASIAILALYMSGTLRQSYLDIKPDGGNTPQPPLFRSYLERQSLNDNHSSQMCVISEECEEQIIRKLEQSLPPNFPIVTVSNWNVQFDDTTTHVAFVDSANLMAGIISSIPEDVRVMCWLTDPSRQDGWMHMGHAGVWYATSNGVLSNYKHSTPHAALMSGFQGYTDMHSALRNFFAMAG